jgi:lysophospholipase L1-like esterase
MKPINPLLFAMLLSTSCGAESPALPEDSTSPIDPSAHSVALSASSFSNFTTYGDSYTAGFGVPAGDAWPNVLVGEEDWSLTNRAVSGSLCMDQADYFLTDRPAQGVVYGFMLGFNDSRVNGTNLSKQAEYSGCLSAGLAWLSTPAGRKMAAQSAGCTTTGSWIDTPAYGGVIGKGATAAGSKLTCTTQAGSSVMLYAVTQVNNLSTFRVTIDGVAKTSPSGTTTFSEIGTVTSEFGRTYAPTAYRFAGLKAVPHTVEITATSADAINNIVHILGGSTSSAGGSPVYVATIARNDAIGYGVDCASVHCNLGSDTAGANYNYAIHSIASQLVGDGLPITVVDITDVLDPNSQSQYQSDHVHPNVLGAQEIANAYFKVVVR